MKTLETYLLAYLFNSFWQIPAVFLAAAWMARLARHCSPTVRHRIWVAALGMELLLPLSSFLPPGFYPRLSFASLWNLLPWIKHPAGSGNVYVSVTAVPVQAVGGFYSTLLASLAAFYLLFVLYQGARLAWRFRLTRLLVLRSRSFRADASTQGRWERLRQRFHLAEVENASSREITSPVTVGFRRKVLLFPEGFVEALAPEDADAAIAHEFAHIARADFAKNLLYRALSLPVAYHLLLRRTLSHIAETREMICDALAADAVAGSDTYAKSLLRLASALLTTTAVPPLHAIGIFDTNTLERRIMSLQSRRFERRVPKRLALGAGALALSLGTFTSALALHIGSRPQQVQDQENTDPTAKVSGGVMAGNLLTRVNPVYPADAKQAGLSGSVVLKARIGKDGSIKGLQLVSGPPELAKSALDAVRQWTYKPYLLNGEPVEVETTITVNFSLTH